MAAILRTSMKAPAGIRHKTAILAPLEGVSDVGYRAVCHSLGAAFTWTEMVRAVAVCRRERATLDLIDTKDPATPTGVQLMAKSAEELMAALATLEDLAATSPAAAHFRHISAVDINLGCPSMDIIRIGGGPALLKRRTKLATMFHALAAWKTTTSLPGITAVGCKIRLGLNAAEQAQKVYLNVVDAAAAAGLDYVVVHARHAKQRSRDAPTWSAIAECTVAASLASSSSSSSGMAIIGNGDVTSRASMDRMLADTGCDGVLVARAAIWNPWVFKALTSPTATADDEYYPTVDEVEAAEQTYLQWGTTKPKYAAFHAQNFSRLKECARTGEWARPVGAIPRTIHL